MCILHSSINNLFSSPMSNLLQVLCTFILFSASISFTQQTQFYYNGFSKVENNITLNSSAKFIKNGVIQLTNFTSRLMGHAFYDSKIKFKDSPNGTVSSFSTAFTFASVPEYESLGGHGLAFTISPSNDLSGALPSQYLGLFNATNMGNLTNHIFAVEFDTVQDFEFGDIDDNHVGIDIDSLRSNTSVSAASFNENSTKHNVTLKSGNTIQAWMDYDAASNLINITISPFEAKPRLPLLSYKFDLSTVLDEYMYIGFSASTGKLSSAHYVLGWSFNMTGPAESLEISRVPSTPNAAMKRRALAISLSVGFFLLFVVLVGLSIWLFRRIKNADKIEEWERNVGPHRFSYKELKLATKGFKEKGMLGRGGFGRVYKGLLEKPDLHIAVKRISHESKQGLQEFVSEIASIGRLRHRNLVQLLGWCRRRGDLMLVYEYMPKGSLDKYLFAQSSTILSWEERFKILKGVATGLAYLHEGWEQVVIHRDVKASNVLLDGELKGRLGDFGLARLHDHGDDLTTTRIVGTMGYLAPELPRTGKATTATDVFAFGTLMLEMVCGRRPIEPKAPVEEFVLVDWVWNKWKEGNITDVVDPRLKGDFVTDEVVMVLKLGLICSSDVPMARPSMRQVLKYLEKEAKVTDILRRPYGTMDGRDLPKEYEDSLGSTSFDNLSLTTYSFGNGNGDESVSNFGHASSAAAPFPLVQNKWEASAS